MTDLKNIQAYFQNYLLHAEPTIFHHTLGSSKVPIEVRLGIYEHAYRARLHDALADTYPVLQNHLGEEEFEKLCYAYIDAYPSSFYSIRWYGDNLALFLTQDNNYSAFPYLIELARFEWTLTLVFDAADSSVLPLQAMQNIPAHAWSAMQLQAHASVHRLSFDWNIVAIWQAITEDQIPPAPQKNTQTVEWLLWRQGYSSQFISLNADEAWALDALLQQQSFETICQGLCQWVDEEQAGIHAASLLKSWIEAGLIAEVIVQEETNGIEE
jgi:hypothetical protein